MRRTLHRALLLTFLTFGFSSAPVLSKAQSCQNLAMSIESFMGEGGPAFAAWEIVNSEGMGVANGMAQFSNNDPFYETSVCLATGCYTVAVDPPFIPENAGAFLVEFFTLGMQITEIEFSQGEGILTYGFCIANPNCPNLLEVTNPTCGVYGVHVAGNWPMEANVAWYINDAVMASGIGSVFEFTPEQIGCYTITAQYAGGPCNDQVFIDTEICFEGCGSSCPDGIGYTSPQCGTVNVEVGSQTPGESVLWTWGDGISSEGGHFATHTYASGGSYVVVAIYTSNLCTEPTTYEIMVLVESCQPECIPVVTTITNVNFPEGPAFACWNLNSEGMSIEVLCEEFTNENPTIIIESCLAPGCYSVFIDLTAEDFGPSIQVSTAVNGLPIDLLGFQNVSYPTYEFCIDETVNQCPNAIWVGEGECGLFQFEVGSFQPGESVDWFFGNQVVENEGHFITHQFELGGPTSVCAFYTSELCPVGIEICTDLVVELCNPNCPDLLEVSNPSCGVYGVHIAGQWPMESSVAWYINDAIMASWIGPVFEFTPEEQGCNTITAQYAGGPCNDQVFISTEICFEGCGGSDCGLEMTAINLGDGWWEFTAYGNPEIYPMHWQVDDGEEILATWVLMQQFEPGEHTVCGTIFSELCPEPVTDCITIFQQELPACTELAVAMDSFVENGGSNSIVWSLVNQNGVAVETGDHFYPANSPFYDVNLCLEDGCYILTGCGGAAITEENFNLILPEPIELISFEPIATNECLGFVAVFALNSNCGVVECTQNLVEVHLSGDYNGFNASDLLDLALSLNGIEVGEIPAITLAAEVDVEGSFCVPDGCYTVQLNAAAPILANAINIEITINGESIEVWSILGGNTSEEIQIGVGADCVDGLDEQVEQVMQVYPIPATDILTISRQSNQMEIAKLFDCTGRVVMKQGLLSPIQQLDVSGLASGAYFLHVGNEAKGVRVIIAR